MENEEQLSKVPHHVSLVYDIMMADDDVKEMFMEDITELIQILPFTDIIKRELDEHVSLRHGYVNTMELLRSTEHAIKEFIENFNHLVECTGGDIYIWYGTVKRVDIQSIKHGGWYTLGEKVNPAIEHYFNSTVEKLPEGSPVIAIIFLVYFVARDVPIARFFYEPGELTSS